MSGNEATEDAASDYPDYDSDFDIEGVPCYVEIRRRLLLAVDATDGAIQTMINCFSELEAKIALQRERGENVPYEASDFEFRINNKLRVQFKNYREPKKGAGRGGKSKRRKKPTTKPNCEPSVASQPPTAMPGPSAANN